MTEMTNKFLLTIFAVDSLDNEIRLKGVLYLLATEVTEVFLLD